MANASIGGLVSGLDTASIISQLMQLEARPQTMLKSRVSAEEKALTSLQTVNSKLANIASKAADLAKLSAWSPSKTSSDNAGVTATADPGTAASQVTFTVNAVATRYRATYTTAADSTSAVMPPNATYTVTFADGSPAFDFDTGDGSLTAIAEALNASGSGLDAALVRTGTDASGNPLYALTLQSERTGALSGVTISPQGNPADTTSFLGGVASSTAGTDASITIQGQSAPLTSASNTFTDIMPGLDVTLAAGAIDAASGSGTATVTVSRDSQSLGDKVKSMVDAVNAALDDIDSLTAYKTETSAPGILAGDSTLRTVRDQLLSTVTRGVNGESLASVGIEVDRSGNLVFDETEFKAAYDSDPTGTAAKFASTATWSGSGSVSMTSASWRTVTGTYSVDQVAGTINGQPATKTGSLLTGATGTAVEGLTVDATAGAVGLLTYTQGFAAALESLAQRVSNSTNGTITSAIQGRTSAVDRMEGDIADWDLRLEQRRTMLERQYGALEVALGKLQNQASWLAGQISGLPSWSSGS